MPGFFCSFTERFFFLLSKCKIFFNIIAAEQEAHDNLTNFLFFPFRWLFLMQLRNIDQNLGLSLSWLEKIMGLVRLVTGLLKVHGYW